MAVAPHTELFDVKFLTHQRDLLEQERTARAEVADALAAEVRNHLRTRETGGAPGEGFGTGETESVELQRTKEQHDRAVARLVEVDAAFGRLDRGIYGVCETCGQPIGRERLEAIPTTARCIDCQARG